MMINDRRLTRRLTLHLFFATLFLLFALNVARADELAVWNFNDSDLNVDHGNGNSFSQSKCGKCPLCSGNNNKRTAGRSRGDRALVTRRHQ